MIKTNMYGLYFQCPKYFLNVCNTCTKKYYILFLQGLYRSAPAIYTQLLYQWKRHFI